jgi:hypothetical protein
MENSLRVKMHEGTHLKRVFNPVSTIGFCNHPYLFLDSKVKWVQKLEDPILLFTCLLHCDTQISLHTQIQKKDFTLSEMATASDISDICYANGIHSIFLAGDPNHFFLPGDC